MIEHQALNDLTYRKMKKMLEKQFPGKYAVIAKGKFLGIEDSLEKAWAPASPYQNALVTKITKKPLRVKMFGSSLRMVSRKN